MKRVFCTMICLALAAPAARGHDLNFGTSLLNHWNHEDHGMGDWLNKTVAPKFDDFPFADHIRGWGMFGLAPFHFGHFGFPALNPERLQTHFENRFDGLMAEYETGLAEIEDFYQSDEYMDVLDDTEQLVDRYDLFLGGVNRQIERLGDGIEFVNDDIMYYMDLITEYESRDDLPERYLDRLLTRLTNTKEHLTDKVDWLTEKQTMLTDNLGTYEMFSSDVSSWLDEIVAAAPVPLDVTTLTAATLSTGASLSAIATTTTPLAAADVFAAPAISSTSVPEPSTAALLAFTTIFLTRRPRRSQRARKP